MSKYNINKEYGLLRYVKLPFSKFIIFLSSIILTNKTISLLNSKELSIKKVKINTSDNKKIPLYILEPRNKKTDKLIIYYHGGGFVFKGSPKHHFLCKKFALDTNSKVIFVDYRVAPKYKYPTPINDSIDAYKWVINNTEILNIDPNKIIVYGTSAGGCLAVEVILKAKEEKLKLPALQMLIYPALDKRMITESMQKYQDTPILNAKFTKKMWKYYLNNNEYISPNERDDYKNFPPTYIEVAEFDCLHDEGVELSKKLQAENIPVELNEIKEVMHAFEFKNTKITQKALKRRIEIINEIKI